MSRILGGLSARAFVVSAICAAITAALVLLVILSMASGLFLKRVAFITPQLDTFLRLQCERDPMSFYQQHRLGSELDLEFYDIVTLQPAVPGMPPVDRPLLARLLAGEVTPARFFYLQLTSRERGGVVLRRVADSGKCSLLQMRWRLARTERNSIWIMIFGLPVLGIMLATVATSFFAVRPMTQRLQRLLRAMQKVGQDSGYASAGDPELDDIGQLSSLLDQAHARIAADARSAADRHAALEQHLANIAHDLRTPLASLQLTIERLSDSTDLTIERLTKSSATPDNQLLRSAIDDVVYMGSLIGNLYLACRLQDGADPLYGSPRLNLCTLVEQVTRRFAKLGRTRAIEVHCTCPDDPVWVCCNSAMAEQMLANLIHNAVVYGDLGGHVAILLEGAGDRFTIQVVDDGPGVPPTELPRLGERTFRSDAARQRDPQGGGLGLAIATEVCRRAHFTVSFAREDPRGLRVTVSGARIA